MQCCKDCGSKMVVVMSFSKGKNEKFCRCLRCKSETKHRDLDNKELNFGEMLDKETYKRNK